MKTIYSVNGIKIGKELTTKYRDKLKAAYETILSENGVEITDSIRKKLDMMVEHLTEKYAEEILKNGPRAEVVMELLFDAEDLFIESEKVDIFMVNGNNFLVEKGIDIRQFAETLNRYGEYEKGNTLYVYLSDASGELVVY